MKQIRSDLALQMADMNFNLHQITITGFEPHSNDKDALIVKGECSKSVFGDVKVNFTLTYNTVKHTIHDLTLNTKWN